MTKSMHSTVTAMLFTLGNYHRHTCNTKTGQLTKTRNLDEVAVKVNVSVHGWVSVSVLHVGDDGITQLQVSASICNGHPVLAGSHFVNGDYVRYTEAECLVIVRDLLKRAWPKFTVKRKAWVKPEPQ